jgi:hypothetical protein
MIDESKENYWNCNLKGRADAFRENLPQGNFVHHESHMDWPGIKMWLLQRKSCS